MKINIMKKLLFIFTTIILVSCNQQSDNNTSIKTTDEKYIRILEQKYQEYYEISNKLNESEGTGEDVKTAYFASQDLINEISKIEVPSDLEFLKNELVQGITLQSKGFGCFSNKSLCSGETEAMELLLDGKIKLDNFIDKISNMK